MAVQNWVFSRVAAQARGWADSLEWSAGTGIGSDIRADAGGHWWRQEGVQVAMFDSMTFALPAHRYRLDESFAVTLSDSAPLVSPLNHQGS